MHSLLPHVNIFSGQLMVAVQFISSSPVMVQSRSPSQTHDLLIHRPDSGHLNSDGSHSRVLQCSPSSEPSVQSGLRSLRKNNRMVQILLFRHFHWLTIAKWTECSVNHRHMQSNSVYIQFLCHSYDSFLHQMYHHRDNLLHRLRQCFTKPKNCVKIFEWFEKSSIRWRKHIYQSKIYANIPHRQARLMQCPFLHWNLSSGHWTFGQSSSSLPSKQSGSPSQRHDSM